MAETSAIEAACKPPIQPKANMLVLGRPPTGFMGEATPLIQPLEQTIDAACDIAIFFCSAAELVGETLENVAAARDRWAKQVLVVTPSTNPQHVTDQLLFSLGFSRRSLPEQWAPSYIAYGFSIQNYKQTPDWLNSRYWANPERWKIR